MEPHAQRSARGQRMMKWENNRRFDQEAVELCLLHSKNDAYDGAYDRGSARKGAFGAIMEALGQVRLLKDSLMQGS